MNNLDWEVIYSVVVYVLKNYPLKIIFYMSLCFILGIILSIIYSLILKKYKVLSREHKYYNCAVKLYIPAIFVINIIFSLKAGLFWGAYEALKKDSYSISQQTYNAGTYYAFKDEQSKKQFVGKLQLVVSDLSTSNQNTKIRIVDIVKAYDTKYQVVDSPKNWLASLFAEKYGERIHTLVLYGMLNAVPHVNISESISYSEFDQLTSKLIMLDSKDVESSIVVKIQNLFLMVLKSQFKTIIKGILIILILLMLIPLVEFCIYRYVMKRKQKKVII
ncbi:hypothetical protein [Chryseobacterium vrystaatense]|uniref:Uncharacterized protein n=1 Tax=Chryseobacterium vrystaatense TaxID=307480 RepID=A0ABR4USR4_9FLAO|nr:hypothetical protein [Chryseobacterium vrystaatense]KFF28312.1 hypothetical protein IW16_03615 [Chryseobacterium vrystaatense]